MYIEPHITVCLVFTNLAAHFLIKDLSPTARHAAKASVDHLLQDPLQGFFCDEAKPTNFNGRPRFNMNFGTRFMDDPYNIKIPVETFLMM